MPKQLSITAYTFDELNDKAKEKAREWMRRVNDGDGHSTDQVSESMTERLAWAGLRDAKPMWSLGYCQGDGACIEYKGVDLWEFVDAQKILELAIEKNIFFDKTTLEPATQTREHSDIWPDDPIVGDIWPDDLKVGDRINVAIEQAVPASDGKKAVWITRITRIEDTTKGNELFFMEKDSVGNTCIGYGYGPPSKEVLEEYKALLFPVQNRKQIERLLADDASFDLSIEHSGNYYHYNSMNVTFRASDDKKSLAMYHARRHLRYLLDDGKARNPAAVEARIETIGKVEQERDEAVEAISDELENAFDEYAKDIGKLLEKIGYTEIESRNSDEAVDEDIKANDYLFTATGRRCAVLNDEEE